MTDLFGIDLVKLNFTSGEDVRGRIIYNTKEDKSIIGIYLNISGWEYAYTITGFGRKCVLRGHACLFGSKLESSQIPTILRAGNHKWRFRFKLPSHLPPSCEHRNGNVIT